MLANVNVLSFCEIAQFLRLKLLNYPFGFIHSVSAETDALLKILMKEISPTPE